MLCATTHISNMSVMLDVWHMCWLTQVWKGKEDTVIGSCHTTRAEVRLEIDEDRQF